MNQSQLADTVYSAGSFLPASGWVITGVIIFIALIAFLMFSSYSKKN